jgi:hypothetical protein
MALAVLLSTVCLSAGCLVHRSVSPTERGRVAEGRLKPPAEATTPEDLVHAFGQPRQVLALADGRELRVYVHSREKQARLEVPFLVGWETFHERLYRFVYEFKDGCLVRYWREDPIQY